ncbi:lysophospholipid acyltransferase family protein [Muricoccus aerilatus]|uniref:lysophospholipid acyltransferase family protein n=1 Tax=Muricoccus aerilatus TaxID=452982 RepID=UPI0009FFEBAA
MVGASGRGQTISHAEPDDDHKAPKRSIFDRLLFTGRRLALLVRMSVAWRGGSESLFEVVYFDDQATPNSLVRAAPHLKAKRRKSFFSRTLKSIGKSPLLWQAVGWYLALCARTTRWDLHGTEPMRALATQPEGFIMAFWHECLPLMPSAWTRFWVTLGPEIDRKEGLVLVSRSRDGALISSALKDYGLTHVAGSSSRGGHEAARKMLHGLRAGSVAVMVPDGPRGPRRVCSEGAIRLASMARVPIVPCGAYAMPSRRLGSWDRMIFPLPIARCTAVVGKPITPNGQDPSILAHELAASLNTAMDEAIARCTAGRAPWRPAAKQ